MKSPAPTRQRHALSQLAAACTLLLGQSALAQQAPTAEPAKKPEVNQLDTVVVTGIRKSLETSVNLKRTSTGLVDGIVAEDIGKFPDTNLAESLSRISGVSIERNNGEGTRITVRGMGPDFNLVLLNGRQMPGSSFSGNGPPTSRSFDFSNLASDGVAALEVYKTSRASSPTGGMGATINVRTQRPLDIKGTVAQVGAKLVNDQTASRVPSELEGKRATPEINGIYSTQSADGTFGIALMGTYQVRDSGYAQALVPDGWHSWTGDVDNDWGGAGPTGWGSLPPAGGDIKNRPGPNSVYSVPQSFKYLFVGTHRERLNGQAVVQIKPSKDMVATLDFVTSEQKFRERRNDISAWFNFGDSRGQFGEYQTGTPSSPVIYGERYTADMKSDVASQAFLAQTRNKNNHVGLNLKWKATDELNFDFDAHHSTATSGADSPLGTYAAIGTATFNRGDVFVDFSNKFPVMSISNTPVSPALQELTGSVINNSYMRNEVSQFQTRGKWKIDSDSSLEFGVALTDVKNNSAWSNVQRNTWGGGVGGPAALPDNIFRVDQIGKYFSRIPGSDDPRLFNNFLVYNFEDVRNAYIKQLGSDKELTASTDFTNVYRTTEKSKSLFAQYNTTWELGVPMDLSAGLRYERTNVDSPSTEPVPTSVVWGSTNELTIAFDGTRSASRSGRYNYTLPSIDWSADLTNNTKLRASYGETIGRPGWNAIQGGRSLSNLARIDGGTGSVGNPSIKPLHSKNWDFSLEHYYAKSSYVAASYFRKSLKDYNEEVQVTETVSGVHTPIGGAYYQKAIQVGGCTPTEVGCIRDYIAANFKGQPGVTFNAAGQVQITGLSTDPLLPVKLGSFANNKRTATINGFELNAQHIFADTGFGVSANFTKVRSNLKYDNNKVGAQTDVVTGLGDSGNLVAFYENADYSARLAYNWRGKFLVANFGGTDGAQPLYVEPYGQFDLSLGYQFDKNLRFQFEAINLTDQYTRTSMRNENQLAAVTQLGRRFMIGARYKF